MKISGILGTAVALAIWAGAASAASVYFNTGRSWDSGYNDYTASDGMTVSLDGVIHSNGDVNRYQSRNVYTASWGGSSGGAGVCVNLGQRCYEEHTVDGDGPDEGLVVHFEHAVRILSVEFSYVDSNDHMSIYRYADSPYPTTLDNPLSPSFTSWIGGDRTETAPYDFSGMVGRYFLIGAADHNDDWKLKSIHYEMAPIPLPAAGFMLLAGMGGLALMRRRQKAAA